MMFGLSDNTIAEITGVFRQHPEIDKVLIFGSRAKGCYREGSDIDLALFGDKINRRILLKISCDIDDLEMLYSIDLINYQDVKDKPIGAHIMRVGQVFYQK
jgi:predicted nucleotidyltransferase